MFYKKKMGTVIKAFGHFIPDKRVTNKELAQRFSITEDWIEEKTGIIERRYFDNGATSDMALIAINNALKNSRLEPGMIDCIIVATMTPDRHCPSTAALLQKKLNVNHTFAFDIMAACSGYLYGIELAHALIETKKYKNILVTGADKFSTIVDPGDRKTTLIFADGAGCSLLSYSETENNIIDTVCSLDSTIAEAVVIPNGGSEKPIDEIVFNEQNHFLRFTSKEVYEGGIQLFIKAIDTLIKKANIDLTEIDLVIPHQANKRMIEELARRLSLPIEKFFINVDYIGNTSAATIPIALSQANELKKLQGTILLASVGAGFTYAASILKF
jgi:3-oxoacyl-[acyl-carrier-protein] synthase-3